MTLPFVSLAAVTAPGPGSSRDLEGVCDHHTMIVGVTTDPYEYPNPGPNASVALEGSHDGETWAQLASATGSNLVQVASVPVSAPRGVLVRHVRARLVSLSGGVNVAVTATIASTASAEED